MRSCQLCFVLHFPEPHAGLAPAVRTCLQSRQLLTALILRQPVDSGRMWGERIVRVGSRRSRRGSLRWRLSSAHHSLNNAVGNTLRLQLQDGVSAGIETACRRTDLANYEVVT